MITVFMVAIMVLIFSPGASAAQSGPIKIGFVGGLTGFMAHAAASSLRGVELRLEEAGYEVAGRKIEFIKEDGASDPAAYVDKARKLVEHDKVDVVLGPLFSPAGFAVASYLTESKTPNITFHVHSIGVLEFGGGNVFQIGTLMGIGYPLGLYAYDELGYRTAAVIRADDVTGQETTGGFIKGFTSRGGTIVQEQKVPADAMDYSSYLIAAKKADCLVWFVHNPAVPPLLKQYENVGLTMPLLLPLTSPAQEVILAEAGDVSLGMIGSEFYTPLIDTDINKRFVDAYHKKYGMYPGSETVGGYNSVSMFLEAVKATGGDTSHDAINSAMKKLKIDTPAGTMSYTEKGLGRGNLYICEVVKMGKRYAWKPIYTYENMVLDTP